MPTINDVIERLLEYLRNESFTPPLRVLSAVELPPPAAYPALAVLAVGEDFGPAAGDVTAKLSLRLSCAGGRPADTAVQLRSLLHQVRRALNRSHGLGGSVLYLRCGALRYGVAPLSIPVEGPAATFDGTVQRAELELQLKYHERDV